MVSLGIEDVTIDKCFSIHSSKHVTLMYVFFPEGLLTINWLIIRRIYYQYFK